MHRHCLKFSISLAALVIAGPVFAADLIPPPPPPVDDLPPPPPPVQVVDHGGSCIYLRADVGGSFHERPEVSKTAAGAGGGWGGGLTAFGETIEDTAFFEAGVGCQLIDTLRFEFAGGFRLKQSVEDPFNSLDLDLQTYTGFVNVYYDITNYGGWTPYIGGGIGVAYHDITNVNFPAGSSSGDEVDFAWNVQAGVSYDISPAAKLDLGYRFIDLGKAISNGAPQTIVDNLIAHEFKIGIRYHFGA